LPNVGPYIYDVSIFGFTRSSIYIYDISSLRVNMEYFCDQQHGQLNLRQVSEGKIFFYYLDQLASSLQIS